MSVGSLVLQLAPIGPLADDSLAADFKAVRFWELDDSALWLARFGDDVGVVATSVRAGCSAELISRLPHLGAICSWGVGYDTIDVAAAAARGIQVSVTPDVLDDCVADMAWALLLATARRLGAADRYVRDGHWQRLGEFPLSTRVSSKRLGILGLGRIGTAIARRGEGFSMAVAYHGRGPRKDVPYRFEPSLRALAEWSDFLVVACPGGDRTHHLVSSAVLRALGPRGILVNVARGSVVDTRALVDALEGGRLGGAGLDVVEGEPGAPVALRSRDDVVFSPHVGSATFETRQAMEQLVIDNVRAFLRSGQVATPAT
jgi:lactate dehydrogenase-like 2-hydroxyacid dehydrogenase